jgi:hypothetical protein
MRGLVISNAKKSIFEIQFFVGKFSTKKTRTAFSPRPLYPMVVKVPPKIGLVKSWQKS